MGRLAWEIAFVLLGAFSVGTFGGFVLRRWMRKPAAVAEMIAPPVAAVAEEVAAAPVVKKPALPRGLAAPRAGRADELRRISGIGPRVERALHQLGVFHFDQIARWNADECAAVSLHLGFAGRVAREQWTLQARVLAAGDGDAADSVVALPQRVRAWRRPQPARRGWR